MKIEILAIVYLWYNITSTINTLFMDHWSFRTWCTAYSIKCAWFCCVLLCRNYFINSSGYIIQIPKCSLELFHRYLLPKHQWSNPEEYGENQLLLNTMQRVPWRCHQMETFSELLALCVGNSPVNGEFPSQGPVTRNFDVSFHLRLNKRLNKQSWDWWFETRIYILTKSHLGSSPSVVKHVDLSFFVCTENLSHI